MIVSKKRNKTEDNFLFYAKFNISTYEKALTQQAKKSIDSLKFLSDIHLSKKILYICNLLINKNNV